MSSSMLHKSVLCATIEFRFTLSTLIGFNVLGVHLGDICESVCLTVLAATGVDVCTGSPGLLMSE